MYVSSPCKTVCQRRRAYVYLQVNYIGVCVHQLSTFPRGPVVCVKFPHHIFKTKMIHWSMLLFQTPPVNPLAPTLVSASTVATLLSPLSLNHLFLTTKHHEHQPYTCHAHLGSVLNLLPWPTNLGLQVPTSNP